MLTHGPPTKFSLFSSDPKFGLWCPSGIDFKRVCHEPPLGRARARWLYSTMGWQAGVLAVGIHRHRSLAHLRANSMHVGGLCVKCGLVLGSCCHGPLPSMAKEASIVDISVPEQHATA